MVSIVGDCMDKRMVCTWVHVFLRCWKLSHFPSMQLPITGGISTVPGWTLRWYWGRWALPRGKTTTTSLWSDRDKMNKTWQLCCSCSSPGWVAGPCFVSLLFPVCLAAAEGAWEAITPRRERLHCSLFNLLHICCESHSDTAQLPQETVRNESSKALVSVIFLCDGKGNLTCSLSGNASSLRQESGNGGGLAQGAAKAEGAHSFTQTQWVCFVPCQVGIRCARTYNSTLYALNYRIKMSWCT